MSLYNKNSTWLIQIAVKRWNKVIHNWWLTLHMRICIFFCFFYFINTFYCIQKNITLFKDATNEIFENNKNILHSQNGNKMLYKLYSFEIYLDKYKQKWKERLFVIIILSDFFYLFIFCYLIFLLHTPKLKSDCGLTT